MVKLRKSSSQQRRPSRCRSQISPISSAIHMQTRSFTICYNSNDYFVFIFPRPRALNQLSIQIHTNSTHAQTLILQYLLQGESSTHDRRRNAKSPRRCSILHFKHLFLSFLLYPSSTVELAHPPSHLSSPAYNNILLCFYGTPPFRSAC